jgi:hypothetical protein
MPRDFFPRKDSDAVSYTRNFSTRLSDDPERYHVTPEKAAEYAVLVEQFAQAYQTSVEPGTATRPATSAKRHARRAVERATRALAGMIRPSLQISLADKILLGVKVRSRPSRIGRPTAAPRLSVRDVKGHTISVSLLDADVHKRRKPKGVHDAMIVACTGEWPTAEYKRWPYRKLTTRTRTQLTIAPHLPPGTKVWLTAWWMNPRGEAGPAATAAYTHVGYGGLMFGQSLKAA